MNLKSLNVCNVANCAMKKREMTMKSPHMAVKSRENREIHATSPWKNRMSVKSRGREKVQKWWWAKWKTWLDKPLHLESTGLVTTCLQFFFVQGMLAAILPVQWEKKNSKMDCFRVFLFPATLMSIHSRTQRSWGSSLSDRRKKVGFSWISFKRSILSAAFLQELLWKAPQIENSLWLQVTPAWTCL